MAMNVSFKKGLAAALPSSRDANTFYYTSDTFALYLGEHLISNEVTAAQFNALEARVKMLEDKDFQTQIDTINETLQSIATSDTVIAIDNRLKAVEADYLKAADKTELNSAISDVQTTANNAEKVAMSKQNALTATQLAAINSGITAAKVGEYDAVKTTVDAFFTSENSINEAYDTLQEIAAYLEADETGAANLTARVGAIETKLPDGTIADTDDIDAAKSEAIAEAANDAADKYVAKVSGKDLSTNDYTTAEKDKLSDIEANAQVNVLEGVQFNGVDLTITSKKVNVQAATTTQGAKADTAIQNGSFAGIAMTKTGDVLNITQTDARTALGLGTAAYKEDTYFEVAGAAAVVQGATNNTVKDCVDAINALNAGTISAKEDINAINTSINDVVNQLTWGSF